MKSYTIKEKIISSTYLNYRKDFAAAAAVDVDVVVVAVGDEMSD